MGLEKRKVNVTFLSYDSVIITNFLYQKTFTLDKSFVVDLHSLKKIQVDNIEEFSQKLNVESPFFICLLINKKESHGQVFFRPNEDKIEIHETKVSIKNNNINYSATVYIKE